MAPRVRVQGKKCPIMDVTGSPHQIVTLAYQSFVLALATLSFRQPSLNLLCATILSRKHWIVNFYLKKFQIIFRNQYLSEFRTTDSFQKSPPSVDCNVLPCFIVSILKIPFSSDMLPLSSRSLNLSGFTLMKCRKLFRECLRGVSPLENSSWGWAQIIWCQTKIEND